MSRLALVAIVAFASLCSVSRAQFTATAQPEPAYSPRSAPSTYQWDNDTGSLNAWGYTNGEVLGIQAYDAVGGADAITAISCSWAAAANGAPGRIFVWQDNGTGPSGATLLFAQSVTIDNGGGSGVFNRYPLAASVPVTGRFYVGFAVRPPATSGLGVRFNPTPPYVSGRTFLCASNTSPLDASSLATQTIPPIDVADVGIPGYLLLRAEGTGSTFTYQGKLSRDGTDYTGAADVQVAIYDGPVAGSAISPTFQQKNVNVTNGLFTLQVPADAAWFVSAPDRYLDVKVRTGSESFTPVLPRQRITQVPAAMVAHVAEKAQTATLAQTAVSAQSMAWSGLLNVPTVLPPWVAATDGISYSGRVGIGTTSPGAALHVKGGPKYLNSYIEGSDPEGTWTSVVNTDAAGRWWSFIVTGSANGEGPGALLIRDNNLAAVRMLFAPTGNIGVGTSTPEQRFSVNGGVQILTGSTTVNGVTYPNSLVFGTYGSTIGNAENSDRIAFQRVNVAQTPQQNISELRLILGDDIITNTNVADSFVIGGYSAGIWAPVYQFRSDGTAYKPGGGAWSVLCDPRLKHDITPMRGTLDRLLALRGYEFLYNDDVVASHRGLPGTQIGLMADEVERVFPDWISRDASGMRMVTERSTTALMVEALRDLRSEKDTQLQARDEKIQRLEKDNAELRERLERLEKAVGAQAK